jgi:hypothetical protein
VTREKAGLKEWHHTIEIKKQRKQTKTNRETESTTYNRDKQTNDEEAHNRQRDKRRKHNDTVERQRCMYTTHD